MRTRQKITVAVAMALAFFSVTVPSASAGARAETTTPYQYRAYHEVSGVRVWDRIPMKRSGLRPVVLSVGRQNEQERWAMFSDNRPGPDWQLIVRAKGDAVYQQEFDRFTAMGYQPTMVTATGSGSAATFAAIFQKKSGKFVARHGMRANELDTINFELRNNNGYMLSSLNVYGTPSDPRYAAVWVPNPSGISWNYNLSISASGYQSVFDNAVKAGYRPSVIGVGPDGKTYSVVWVKDGIRPWYAFHGMGAAQYQARFDEMTAKGLYPASIDMENGVYAAVFTAR